MRDIFIALVFIGLVTYPALAAMIPNLEMDDETRRSLAPALASGDEALHSGNGTASISSH
ncbi:MAG: hypothetical protein WBE76_11320 [Terracidiphilus sp.]